MTKVPVLFPLSAVLWNILYVGYGVVAEGRFRMMPFMYIFIYAGTLRPALRGDLMPYFTVTSGGLT